MSDLESYMIDDDDDDSPEFSEVTCDNGCPKGARGRHRFSCYWTGDWFYGGQDAKVLGASSDGRHVCLEVNGGHIHAGRYESLSVAAKPHQRLSRVRHPDVVVHLSTGQNGNVFAVLGTVAGALRKAGYASSADRLANDMIAGGSYNEALRLIQRTVSVT